MIEYYKYTTYNGDELWYVMKDGECIDACFNNKPYAKHNVIDNLHTAAISSHRLIQLTEEEYFEYKLNITIHI